LHCSCFDACGFNTGFLANRARNHFDCGGHADAPLPPM
jgi:hypothetical protein